MVVASPWPGPEAGGAGKYYHPHFTPEMTSLRSMIESSRWRPTVLCTILRARASKPLCLNSFIDSVLRFSLEGKVSRHDECCIPQCCTSLYFCPCPSRTLPSNRTDRQLPGLLLYPLYPSPAGRRRLFSTSLSSLYPRRVVSRREQVAGERA